MGRHTASAQNEGRTTMEVTYTRCAGLDVHKKSVVACVVTPEGQETRTFGTMTAELLDLGGWLQEHGVTHVAMESSGIYWKPVYNLLEVLDLEVLVVNAQHIKAVPGRKTDVKDAAWIADLLRHGLLRGSYIPDRAQRELRDLVRHRRGLMQQRSRVINQIEKLLESANVKLGAVVSDLAGVSGRAMLEALAAGIEDPALLAGLAKGSLRGKRAALLQALRGLMGGHQRMLLQSLLRQLAFLDGEVAALDDEVARRLAPFDAVIRRLDGVPGIGRRSAEEILAETGTDMSRFPTAAHLCSWARVCPGNDESAGKRRSGRTGHANRWLRAALTQAAHAAARKRGSYFHAQYARLGARRGKKRATIAVAHSLLTTIYHMLARGTEYEDLGDLHFDRRDASRVQHRLVQRLEGLGFRVTLEAA
jgi:transposase